MKLLIDLGNTRLKSALWDGVALRPVETITHGAAIDNVDFSTWFASATDVSAIFIASVAGEAVEQRVLQALTRRFGVEPSLMVSPAGACGVRNAYAQPQRLGIDRFLALVAAHAMMQAAPAVIASCGTALTLDALAADGVHLGGLICASPPLMLDALTRSTGRLAKPREARIVELADNTSDALESGAWLAAAALLERFVDRAAARFGATPAVILTGGGGARLSTLVAPRHRVEPDLVLRGLSIYADSQA